MSIGFVTELLVRKFVFIFESAIQVLYQLLYMFQSQGVAIEGRRLVMKVRRGGEGC